MAKSSKKKEPKSYERYVDKEQNMVIVSTNNKFIYEVMIFVMATRAYYLKDTLTIQSVNYKQIKRKIDKAFGRIITQEYKLIGAPKEWLQSNGYTYLEEDVRK